jgi:hypothetical protein
MFKVVQVTILVIAQRLNYSPLIIVQVMILVIVQNLNYSPLINYTFPKSIKVEKNSLTHYELPTTVTSIT